MRADWIHWKTARWNDSYVIIVLRTVSYINKYSSWIILHMFVAERVSTTTRETKLELKLDDYFA